MRQSLMALDAAFHAALYEPVPRLRLLIQAQRDVVRPTSSPVASSSPTARRIEQAARAHCGRRERLGWRRVCRGHRRPRDAEAEAAKPCSTPKEFLRHATRNLQRIIAQSRRQFPLRNNVATPCTNPQAATAIETASREASGSAIVSAASVDCGCASVRSAARARADAIA